MASFACSDSPCGPLGLQRLLGLDKHLRVFDQILADDLPDGVNRQVSGRACGCACTVGDSLCGGAGIARAVFRALCIADSLRLSRLGGGEGKGER